MLSSIGRYVYDRRRGLLKSAGVVTSLYLAGKYVVQRLEEVKEAVLTERTAKEGLRRRFQQNMQDCTYTIMAYMPTLAGRILEELDVERISLELQKRSKKQVQHDTATSQISNEETDATRNSVTLPSASVISVEAGSPLSGYSHLSEKDTESHLTKDIGADVAQSDDGVRSETQNTSSFLSAMESTDPLSASLPMSSSDASSFQQRLSDPLVESATSWVNFSSPHPLSAATGGDQADDERPTADIIPVIPDLELPALDLSGVSIVDTQSRPSEVLISNGGSVLSHTEDMQDQGSLQQKSKAELWHELKIMTFTRVLVIIYSTTLLALQIHVQLNLIGRYKYVQSVKETEREERRREHQRETEEAAFASLGLVGSLMASVGPSLAASLGMSSGLPTIQREEAEGEEDVRWSGEDVDEDVERKYLTLSWWLLHIGWRDVAARVRPAVEEVLQGVSLKSKLSMKDIQDLFDQIRGQVEFTDETKQRRTDIVSAIFPLSPSAEQNVLIQGGISPHLATIDPPLRNLLNETKAFVASPDFELVWSLALDRVCNTALSGIEQEVFGESPIDAVTEGDASATIVEVEEKTERLAGILPGLARWCHPALYSMPNELVEALGSMRELAGLAAIIYSSYDEQIAL